MMWGKKKCARCNSAKAPRVACKHALELPLIPIVPADRKDAVLRCTSCGPKSKTCPLCDGCHEELLRSSVPIHDADAARGFAIANWDQAALLREVPSEPVPALAVGRWAKLTLVTEPLARPQHLESLWVLVEGAGGDGWHGIVDNDPIVVPLRAGDPIHFQSDQVTAVGWDTTSRELPSEHVCEICHVDLRRNVQDDLDEGDESLLDAVTRFGFSVIQIAADEQGTGFAFTVGLAHRFEHPELIIFGADHEPLGEFVRSLGNRVVEGERFAPGDDIADLVHRGRARFLTIADGERYRREFLGYACWFHRSRDFPVLQLQWSDATGHYPGDREFDLRLRRWQEDLTRT